MDCVCRIRWISGRKSYGEDRSSPVRIFSTESDGRSTDVHIGVVVHAFAYVLVGAGEPFGRQPHRVGLADSRLHDVANVFAHGQYLAQRAVDHAEGDQLFDRLSGRELSAARPQNADQLLFVNCQRHVPRIRKRLVRQRF
nr:MAG TPA: hypothetical protein [Caudoviricetes sp.]